MIRIFVVQSMAIHPGDWIYIDRKGVIHDRDGFDEPFLIVKGTMSDSEMKNIGQIQAAHEPAKDEINCPYEQSAPGPQMSRSEIHTGERVGNNNQIAHEIVDFHDRSPVGLFKQKSDLLSNASPSRGEECNLNFGAFEFPSQRSSVGRGAASLLPGSPADSTVTRVLRRIAHVPRSVD